MAGGLAAFLGRDDTSTTTSAAPPPEERGFDLPLADDPSVLTLGAHEKDLLVGIAARRGGPVEIVALRGETPVPRASWPSRSGARVEPVSCGRGCSRVSEPVLDGRAAP